MDLFSGNELLKYQYNEARVLVYNAYVQGLSYTYTYTSTICYFPHELLVTAEKHGCIIRQSRNIVISCLL